jgi:uracil-DNA glycosylase
VVDRVPMIAHGPNERERYDSWWTRNPGRPCTTCKDGLSEHAASIRTQGASFYPMHNFGPDRPSIAVRYLLVAEEPAEAGFDAKLRSGRDPEASRNFGGTSATKSIDSALQFAAREWLCEPNETFLLTDMAKCAVRNPRAEALARQQFRWANCAPFLRDEASLYDLRAVIGVGGDARAALRKRDWGPRHAPFKVTHWAARSASLRKLLSSSEERYVASDTLEKYRAFIDDRRAELGQRPKQQRIGLTAIAVLAVYRKQFACIRLALSNRSFLCARRDDGTCCRAVPRSKRIRVAAVRAPDR